MKKLQAMTGKRLPEFPVAPDDRRPHPHTSVGIEIEADGVSQYEMQRLDIKRWHVVSEGSLQGGCEFISDPVWGTAIVDALDEIKQVFAEHPPYMSYRTSVHVHMNVLDMYNEHLVRMTEAYLYYELPIYRIHSDWQRYDNIFCVPAAESALVQAKFAQLLGMLDDENVPDELLPSKYCGYNTNNLYRLGTIEFRHMGGTTDTDRILSWIDLLLRLKVSSQQGIDYRNPEEFWGPQRELLTIEGDDLAKGERILQRLSMWR